MSVLVDTGGLFALADANDVSHDAVVTYVKSVDETLIVPVTVLSELDYLITSRLGIQAEIAILRSIDANEFRLENLELTDFRRAIEIIQRYAGSDVGFVDASIAAIAERLGVRRILTVDRRHFGMFRPRHCPAFDLVP